MVCVDRLRDSSDPEEADDVPYLNETEYVAEIIVDASKGGNERLVWIKEET